MNAETIKKIFQSPFNYPIYSREIVHSLFGCNDVLTQPELIDTSSLGDSSHYVGQMEDAEGRLLGFFYTRVAEGSDVRRKRVGLRKLIQPYLRYEVDAAIAVFDDGLHWRLSYICDHKEGTTSAKRFSYVLGDRQGQYKTPLERLDKVAAKVGHFKMEDLRDAFSVDALSKEFFDEYHRHYDRILKTTVELISKDPTLYSGLSKLFADYIKKMMGRIVFLHFLQKKDWLNGDPDFLKNLFFMQPLDRREDFLEQVLEPLFFGIFNTEPQNREKLFCDEGWDVQLLEQWKGLPYLNGGLFERDSMDTAKLKLPASLFERLFEFMASYNFTVDENDPDDADIGVDPEMLGKIFESLLEDNKAKGAFYTPKEIVRYMCKESLIAYLGTQATGPSKESGIQATGLSKESGIQATGLSKETGEQASILSKESGVKSAGLSDYIRKFVEQHEFPEELEPYREVLDTALRNVKICDPAIGSGAFPMGLLNELWRCREALEERATNPSLMGTQANGLSQAGSLYSKEGQSGSLNPYSRAALKREIIENNIYGVDIEKGAIDIARLRFWLSIVVDAEKPEPLPNFDYKFMQGNSLIESYKGFDLSRISNRLPGGQSKSIQLLIGLDSDHSRKNLQRLMRDYFSVTDHKQKDGMRQAINDAVKQLITDFIGGTNDELKSLNPSANKDFFLWHTWFKDIFDNGGFDIVIGNPPYIRQELLGMEYKSKLINTYPNVGNGIADICVYFFGLGISILNKNGVLSFITSNKFLKTKYGKELRHTLTTKVCVDRIIDFFELPVFNASTDAGITILFKCISHGPTRYYPIKTLNNLNLTDITSGSYLTTIKSDSEWQFIENSQSTILDKIKDNTITLKEFTNNKIFYGIKTGFNKAFVIKDYALAQRLLNSESAPIIKKYAQSTDIQMWGIKNDNTSYLVGTFPALHLNIEKYPTLKNYLLSWGIERLEQTGKKYIIDGEEIVARKKTNNKWFETQDSIAYYEEFEKPKLIYIHTAKDHQFYFDTEGHYINNSCYMIVTDSKFLFCFLNSKLFKYYKRLKFVAYGDGQEAGRCKLDYNKMVTVPIKKGVDEKPFEELVEKIQTIKQSNPTDDTSDLEHQIDKLIYQLYNLTPEEISIIEGS